MGFDMQYIEESMHHPAWKTRFVEAFSPLYLDFVKYCPKNNDSLSFGLKNLFNRMIKILQKRLKEENGIKTTFPTDVVAEGQKHGYIEDKELCFEIIKYLNSFLSGKSSSSGFKNEYLKVLDRFYRKFSKDVEFAGNISEKVKKKPLVDKFFGLEEEYYEILLNELKKTKAIKFVRIFGSRANGTHREFSDIDLIFEGNYTEKGFARIIKKLSSLEIPYFIDIYDVHYRLKPFIFRNTMRSTLFYKRSDYFKDDFVSFLDM